MVIVRCSYDTLGEWGQPRTFYEVIGKYKGNLCSLEWSFYDPTGTELPPGTVLNLRISMVATYEHDGTAKESLRIDWDGTSSIHDVISENSELKSRILHCFLEDGPEKLYNAAYRIDHMDEVRLKLLDDVIEKRNFVSNIILLGLGSPSDDEGDIGEELWYKLPESSEPCNPIRPKPRSQVKVHTPDDILAFGKNIGERLSEIYRYHPQYIEWLIENVNEFAIDMASFRCLPKPTIINSREAKTEFEIKIQKQSDRFITVRMIRDSVNKGKLTLREVDFRFSDRVVLMNENKVLQAKM